MELTRSGGSSGAPLVSRFLVVSVATKVSVRRATQLEEATGLPNILIA
jgi:hypothetical protein